MASSKCPSCNNNSFQIVENKPSGYSFNLKFVQCSSCGAVVSVLDYFNIGHLVRDQERLIKELQREVHTLSRDIHTIKQDTNKIVSKIK